MLLLLASAVGTGQGTSLFDDLQTSLTPRIHHKSPNRKEKVSLVDTKDFRESKSMRDAFSAKSTHDYDFLSSENVSTLKRQSLFDTLPTRYEDVSLHKNRVAIKTTTSPSLFDEINVQELARNEKRNTILSVSRTNTRNSDHWNEKNTMFDSFPKRKANSIVKNPFGSSANISKYFTDKLDDNSKRGVSAKPSRFDSSMPLESLELSRRQYPRNRVQGATQGDSRRLQELPIAVWDTILKVTIIIKGRQIYSIKCNRCWQFSLNVRILAT